MKGGSATPAAHHMFGIAEYVTKMFQTDTDLFHLFVAHLLYLSKRARRDIHLEVSFLCNRVRDPDNYYYNNMERVMKYI